MNSFHYTAYLIGLSLYTRFSTGIKLCLTNSSTDLLFYLHTRSGFNSASNVMMTTTSIYPSYFDIALNLSDLMYQGIYNGKKKHPEDIKYVLTRAQSVGLNHMILLGGSLEDSEIVVNLSDKWSVKGQLELFSTVGVHPTRCQEFLENGANHIIKLKELIRNNHDKVIAVGEIGLDYDRLHFCPADVQKEYFSLQLEMAYEVGLPVIFHMREAFDDFIIIINRYRDKYGPIKGVVHSFTGTLQQAKVLIDMGMFIGLNGCSLKSKENIETVKNIPIDQIMLETDAPYCAIRPTHESYPYLFSNMENGIRPEKWTPDATIKGRNEPQNIKCVAEVIYQVTQDSGNSYPQFCNRIFENTKNFFSIRD